MNLSLSRSVLLRRGFAVAAIAMAVGPAAASADIGTNGAVPPSISWAPCEDFLADIDPAFECATALVPRSYRSPAGAKLGLALSRLPHTGAPGTKLGTLFVNPGGPGVGGRDYPLVASPALRDRFDVVGFDPRGVAASEGVVCFADEDEAFEYFGNPFPTTFSEELNVLSKTAQGTSRCGSRAGAVLKTMGTGNVARDLELLRRSVGDAKLSFFGASYGSVIGETYTNLFPTKTRAVAIDGVVDPVQWTSSRTLTGLLQPSEYRLRSYVGTRKALDAFLAECASVGPDGCAYAEPGSTASSLSNKLDALFAALKREPVEIDLGFGPEIIGYQDLHAILYSDLNVAIITAPGIAAALQGLQDASMSGARIGSRARVALRASLTRLDNAGGPARADGDYDGWLEQLPAVQCLDNVNPRLPLIWPTYARSADRIAGPGFGSFWTYGALPCATWPVSDVDKYDGPWSARPTTPTLLIGNRQGDPSTPYEGAQAAASTLGNARLLSVDIYGHTAYGLTGACVDEAVDSYLIDLVVPAAGTVCEPDFRPFDVAPEPLVAARVEAAERVAPRVDLTAAATQ